MGRCHNPGKSALEKNDEQGKKGKQLLVGSTVAQNHGVIKTLSIVVGPYEFNP